MKVAIEEISPVKKTITVEIPEDVVSQEFQTVYSDLKRRVKIPGFRPGKAPLALLERRYAQTVQEDVIRRLVPDYFRRAIKETQLSPIEPPSIENIEVKKDAPMMFRATFEIKPTFKLGEYRGLRIKNQRLALKDDDVDKALESLREKQAVLEVLPVEHAIVGNDYALVDFQGFINGKAFDGGTGQGVLVHIGSKTLVSGFEDQLIGHKSGEKFEIEITFPSDYYKPDLVGEKATFQVTVREVKTRVFPDLDNEFAKDVGEYSSLDALKDKIRDDLKIHLKKEEDRNHKKILVQRLIELHPFEVPGSLVEGEMRDILDQIQSKLPQGVSMEQARIDAGFVEKEVRPAAVEKVKRQFILHAIADHEGIDPSKEEIDEVIAKMAREVKTAPEDLKRLIISRQGSLDGIKEQLREDKALETVLSKTVYE